MSNTFNSFAFYFKSIFNFACFHDMSLSGKEISLPDIGTWAFNGSWNYPCLVVERDSSNNRSTGQTCTIYSIDLKLKTPKVLGM
jgi:hypothetical protein